jgi:hypothetical protein
MKMAIKDLKDDSKALAKRNPVLGWVAAVAAVFVGVALYVASNTTASMQMFELAGETVTVLVKGDEVEVVSATTPVSVTEIVSDTEAK